MKAILIKCVRWYQRNISAYTRPSCRFMPTCSAYAIEAIEVHGASKGAYLSIKRILKCNPCFKAGIDNVPLKKPTQKPPSRIE